MSRKVSLSLCVLTHVLNTCRRRLKTKAFLCDVRMSVCRPNTRTKKTPTSDRFTGDQKEV
ncbi:hypothetical protein JOB18_035900 [Solea senegalensis]|uniref:Secreted protein n=1 Tax=Solea senegalensis TaxID=28829 RepID=A0AAV6S4Z9_SOLSE|nr:hypothetical protein JOB18_035900 [Solea senegalensis]